MLVTQVPPNFKHRKLNYGPYSPSKLLVAQCPARFQGKYVLKDRIVGDSINAARGSAIHQVLEKITLATLGEVRTPITSQILNDWVVEAVTMYPAAYDQIKLVRDACSAYITNPPKFVGEVRCEISLGIALYEEETLLDDVTPRRLFTPVAYELDAKKHTRQNPEAYFGGTLDMLFVDHVARIVTIVDHKTTPSANKNSDVDFQMGCYAWLGSLCYPDYEIRTVIHYAHPELNFYAPPERWDYEALQDKAEEIAMRIEAVDSFTEYPAIPGAYCMCCHMVEQCPEYLAVSAQNARGEINLNMMSIEDAKRIAGQLTITEGLFDKLNTTLKKGMERLGLQSVAIPGRIYQFKSLDKKVDWDATEVRIMDEVKRAEERLSQGQSLPDDFKLIEWQNFEGILKAHGIPVEKFKQWRSDKLKSLYQLDKPALLEELAKYTVFDKGTRFGASRL
jgi:hypothetical protein